MADEMQQQQQLADALKQLLVTKLGPEAAAEYTDDEIAKLLAAGYKGARQLRLASRESLWAVGVKPALVDELVHAFAAPAAAPPAAADPMSRFRSLLSGKLDNKVLQRVAVDFAPQVLTVQDTAQAKLVYNRALQLPGTSTKFIAEQQGIIINGDYMPNMPSKSALVYAFQGTMPLLLKIPRDGDAAEHESHVWQQLCSGGTPPHLAGPVTLLNLQNESTGKGKKALQMPIYPATLQHVPRLTPCAALKIGIDIKTGLQHMHSHKLAHCDVKAPNIFIDGSGNAFLGDYGAVRSFGKDADEKTLSHVPVDPPEDVDVHRATCELDFLLLAVTLLERMKLLQLGAGQLRMASVLTAAKQVTHKELHAFIMILLKQEAQA